MHEKISFSPPDRQSEDNKRRQAVIMIVEYEQQTRQLVDSPIVLEMSRAMAIGSSEGCQLFQLEPTATPSTVSLARVVTNEILGLPVTATSETRRSLIRYALQEQIEADLSSGDAERILKAQT